MHAGTIEWNGSDLSRLGKPTLTIRRAADPPAPAVATRMLVALTVTVELEALDPGTIQARAEWLADSMRVGEGILRGSSGSGHAVEWLAAPGDSNLADVISGLNNSVSLTFTAVENHAEGTVAALTQAVFTPAGATTPLVLHAVRDLKQDIKTSRHAERNGSRSATTHTHAFTARFAQSNSAEPLATRLAYLQAQAGIVKALDTRQGVLVIGDFNSIVRVSEFSPVIDERAGTLDVQVQAYAITLPDADTAECLFEIDEKAEEGSGEVMLSISGEIAAETRDIALAKLESLRAAQNIAGQRISGYSAKDKRIDGFDSAAGGDDWTGALSFSIEVRKLLPGGHHTLRISTQKDIRSGMRWSYSGTVKAASAAAALVTARAIATAANHPVQTRSEETLEQASTLDEPLTLGFIKLDFSYEFEGPADGFLSGEITTETVSPLAGEWRRTTSGFLIASSKAAAETRLALLLAAEVTPLETTRRWSEVYHDTTGGDATPKRVAMKLDFTCGLRITRTRATVEFTDSTQTSLSSMNQTRTVSGTLWTNSRANADAALALFATSIFGASGAQETSSSHAVLQTAAEGVTGNVTGNGFTQQWIKLDFSLGKTSRLTGVVGYDLLEATMTMERTGSINATVITPIPYGRAVAQAGTGYIPGKISINASAKAVNQATARSWVQGKRALVSGIGTPGTTRHETDPPRESCGPEYEKFDTTAPKLWSFSGSYGWTFTGNVLDGIWETGLPA